MMQKATVANLTILLLAAGCFVRSEAPEPTYLVLRVVDGDTIVLDLDGNGNETKNEHVRLFGFDAPETRTRDLDEKKHGLAAKQHLESLVLGKRVSFDIRGAGYYGRLLGVIRLGDRDINKEMTQWLAAQKKGK